MIDCESLTESQCCLSLTERQVIYGKWGEEKSESPGGQRIVFEIESKGLG